MGYNWSVPGCDCDMCESWRAYGAKVAAHDRAKREEASLLRAKERQAYARSGFLTSIAASLLMAYSTGISFWPTFSISLFLYLIGLTMMWRFRD